MPSAGIKLVPSTGKWEAPAVRVRALARVIVLCSWVRHLLSQCLSVPRYINEFQPIICLRVTLRWTSIPSREEWNYSWSLHASKTGISWYPEQENRKLVQVAERNETRSERGKTCYWC